MAHPIPPAAAADPPLAAGVPAVAIARDPAGTQLSRTLQ